MNKYGLNMNSIYDAVIRVIKRKVKWEYLFYSF
jgi:hypothetical protein